MKIEELKFTDDMEILANSFVEFPAIEKDFQYFSKDNYLIIKPGAGGIKPKETDTTRLLDPVYGWKYWKMATSNNEKPIITDDNGVITSHEFCQHNVFGYQNNKGIYTIDEIHGWHRTWDKGKNEGGWISNSDYTKTFAGSSSKNFNLDNQLFNCRHYLTAVRDINELKSAGIKFSSQRTQMFSMDFAVTDANQQVVKGPVMIAEKLIERKDEETGGQKFVYFSRDTIKKLKEKYGFNRTTTLQHEEDITGNAILLDSWIYPEKDDNCKVLKNEYAWCMSYKILNPTLWELVKTGKVRGFSVELAV